MAPPVNIDIFVCCHTLYALFSIEFLLVEYIVKRRVDSHNHVIIIGALTVNSIIY